MNSRFPRQLLTCVLAFAVFFALLGTEVQCTPAEARPSIESLQAQIDALQAELNNFPSAMGVFDAEGAEVGWLTDVRGAPSTEVYRVYLDSIDATVLIDIAGMLVTETPGGQIFFDGLDCTGQAFVEREYVGRVTTEGGRFFIGRPVPSIDEVAYLSRLPGVCANDQASGPLTDAIPADEITLDDLGLEFPLPAPPFVAPMAQN